MPRQTPKAPADHPENRAEDGFPLGLTKPVDQLDGSKNRVISA